MNYHTLLILLLKKHSPDRFSGRNRLDMVKTVKIPYPSTQTLFNKLNAVNPRTTCPSEHWDDTESLHHPKEHIILTAAEKFLYFLCFS